MLAYKSANSYADKTCTLQLGATRYTKAIIRFNDPMDTQGQSETSSAPQKPQVNMLMGILSYLGILVIVPLIAAKDDPFVKFHVKQGLVLAVIEVAVWVLGSVLWQLWTLWQLVNLAAVVFSIIGIINVAQAKQKELPLVGSFAKYFTF